MTTPPATHPRHSALWIAAVVAVPIVLLVAVTVWVASSGDRILSGFGHNPPAADEFAVQRTQFLPGRIEIDLLNPQRDTLTPAMVTVDAAIVNDFRVEGGSTAFDANDRRTLVVPYDWIRDDPYLIGVVSSTGITTEIEVAAAVPAASADRSGLGWGALVGLLVGFVPVALGLAWLPALRQLSTDVIDAFLAFTAGLLTFLAVEAAAEALETQAQIAPAFGGPGVVLAGIVGSMVLLGLVGVGLRRGVAATTGSAVLSGGALALLIAVGIGLHNMAEGLAIGTSFTTGESRLAIALVIGFMVHNITEGIGIASPIARAGGRLGPLRGLGLAVVAGVPAVFGIWLGRYVAGPLFATLCFALAAGAAAQVVIEVGRVVRRGEGGLTAPRVQAGFALGIVVMWLTGALAG